MARELRHDRNGGLGVARSLARKWGLVASLAPSLRSPPFASERALPATASRVTQNTIPTADNRTSDLSFARTLMRSISRI